MKKHTLTMIAGEMNMSAKTLRAILRKNGMKRPGTRWEFSTEEKNEVKAMLKARKKNAKTEVVVPAKKSTRRKAPASDAGVGAVH